MTPEPPSGWGWRSTPWLPDWAHTHHAHRWGARVATALVVVAVLAGIVVGASRPANPMLEPADAMTGLAGHSLPTSRVPGFGQIGFRIISPTTSPKAGPVRCALLADTEATRAQGMMGRRDLAGYDAMIFRFYDDTSDEFFNKGVPIPLSIAWFDSSGVLVGTADMPVCPVSCPQFGPQQSYRIGLEVPEGGLHHLGIGGGSQLLVGGHCGS